MTEREALAQQIAGDHYGMSLDSEMNGERMREYLTGRLDDDERKAFDAGWEAAKAYYENQQ